MKLFIQFLSIACLAITVSLTSCTSEEEAQDPGTFTLFFDNKIGGQSVSLKTAGDNDYQYTDDDNQSYNLHTYAYYISEIQLEGPDGVRYIDPLNVSPDADKVTGYYHVTSFTSGSNIINLADVDAGTYDKIRFTIGINEAGVQEGAAGGVLDPANGAWFWNWNAGYIGFGVEGNASNSGQQYVDWGNGFETLEGTFAIHVGGWKDVEPAPGEDPKFVNNVKTIELDFGTTLNIEAGLKPEAHINVDFAEILKGTDFSTTYSVHRPDLGSPYADKFEDVFELDHVHQ